jgi:eukaryotic-like serine/threonine-protein kinase
MSDRALRTDITEVEGSHPDPRDAAASLGSTADQPFPDAALPRRTLGRLRLLERLGAGGMGVVYRAYDPELAREVATKLLHPDTARSHAARARLRQEARALAEVSHPNVVQVYDVGEQDGSIYISMELVPGVDLRQWLAQAPRRWQDVLELLVAAGRGLQAAHERGLVHRDFKPSNVLVGHDGRARVVDFGLARLLHDAHGDGHSDGHSDAEAPTASELRSGALTESGMTLGTPAYMAPEQHRGLGTDARSDQYAFCTSVWESLYGERPFHGTALEELVTAKEHDPPRTARAHGVPRRVQAVLRRGLRPMQLQRWPDMAALLAALERAAQPRRGSLAMAAVLVVGGVGALAHAVGRDEPQGPAACRSAAERLAGVWDEAREDELHRAIASSGLAHAEPTWARMRTHLHDYAAQWTERYDALCEARADPRADAAMLDRRMLCLNDRRDELASLVDVLVEGQASAVHHVVQAVAGLRPPSSCDDPRGSGREDGPRQAEVDALRREILRAEALGKLARHAEGLALAEAAVTRATAAALPSLRAEALLVAGTLHKGKAAPAVAEERLSDAVHLAVSIDRDDLAARAAIELVDVQGAWLSRYDEALEWDRHAQAAILRLGHDPALAARRLTALGHLELTLGHHQAAIDAFERSLVFVREVFGEGHPRLASAQSDLGHALVRAGRFDEAFDAAQQALMAGEQAYGPDHPEVGTMHGRIAHAWVRKGNYDEAVVHTERAIAILEAALGPTHPNVAANVLTLGQIEQRRGRFSQAEAAYHRALPGMAGTINEAFVHAALGELARERGDAPTALVHARRSRELREALQAPDDTMVAMGLIGEALALAYMARDDEALAAFARAHAIDAKTPLPPNYRLVLDAYEGRAHLAAGRPAAALAGLERALARQEQLGAEAIDRAEVRFYLVQALWAVGRKDEARAQLAVVERELAPLGPHAEHRRRSVRAWTEREAINTR